MKVLLLGAGGQLGQEIVATLPKNIELLAFTHEQLDISDKANVKALVKSEQPDWILNAAAYTNVDAAEDHAELAFSINCNGVRYLANAAKLVGSRMLQISTDYVFSGEQGGYYQIYDKPEPVNIYGMSKYEGEKAIIDELGKNAAILRSSWIYSRYGKNFVKTMLKLMREKKEIGVVCDQIGTPTWAHNLAAFIWLAITKDIKGIHHWTDSGVASWYDFATVVNQEAVRLALLNRSCIVHPIMSVDYPVVAQRPSCCVLSKTNTENFIGYEPDNWISALRSMLKSLV